MKFIEQIEELERQSGLIGQAGSLIGQAITNLREIEGGATFWAGRVSSRQPSASTPVLALKATQSGTRTNGTPARKPLSAAARKRISIAQKKRHAEARRANAAGKNGKAKPMAAGGRG